MPIDAIGPSGSGSPLTGNALLEVAMQRSSSALTADATPSADNGAGFASALAGAIENVQSLQATSNQLAVQAVTGDLNDIHQATLASTRAQVTLELVAAVRNKGVDAFNEIMRMQA